MVSSTIPAWIQALGALVVAGAIVGGFYHRQFVQPAEETADTAMSRANEALDVAESTQDRVDNLDDDLRESLEELSANVNDLVEGMERQRREARGTSYQLYVLAEAINESDEAPDVPVPDEDDFLRGGGD